MHESLHDLNLQLHKHETKLNLAYGNPVDILIEIFQNYKINEVIVNEDFTPI